MARRFILNEEDIIKKEENKIEFIGSEVKHIHSLRLNIGDSITINEDICKITKMTKNSIEVKLESKAPSFGIPKVDLTLYIGILKGDKMDLVIQKAVELGVKNIVPFFSKNVVVKLDDKERVKKKTKFQTIVNEACKQCGRTDIVNVLDFIKIEDINKNASSYDKIILAYENEKVNLCDVLKKSREEKLQKIAAIIGAEGGFDIKEVEELKKEKKLESVSIGSRILRAETAAISLISIIMYELDR